MNYIFLESDKAIALIGVTGDYPGNFIQGWLNRRNQYKDINVLEDRITAVNSFNGNTYVFIWREVTEADTFIRLTEEQYVSL